MSVNVKSGTEHFVMFTNDEAPVGPGKQFVNRL